MGKRSAPAAASAVVSDSAVVDGLYVLAVRYEQNGYYLQAIKSLRAICSLDLPAAAAIQYTLHLAKLLMNHTENKEDAKRILEAAQRSMAKVPGSHCLKCEVHAALAKCYENLGQTDPVITTCEAGIQACISGASSRERQNLVRWQCYFWQQRADANVIKDNELNAINSLEQGMKVATEHQLLDQQVLFQLFQLQLHLQYWQKDQGSDVIERLKELLELVQWPQELAALRQQARLHFRVLQVLYMIRLGYMSMIKPKPQRDSSQRDIMDEIEELLPQVFSQPAQYTWMPMPMVQATVLLLKATLIKSQDKSKECLAAVAEALAVVDEHLAGMGIKGNVSEEHISLSIVWDCRVPLALRLLLFECRAQVHLLTCQFLEAQADICAFANTIEHFPNLLASFKPAMHMLAGMYAHATGHSDAASEHYSAVRPEQQGPETEAAMSIALEVMAVLASGMDAAVGYCADLMASMDDSTQRSLGYSERASLHLAGAMLKLEQQQPDVAKTELSRALKLAHNRLANHQMVTQVLTFFAPLQYSRGDVSGAESMITSTITLAKAIGDSWAQSMAAQQASELLGNRAGSEGKQMREQYSSLQQRKQQEVVQRQQLAQQNAEQHKRLLRWGL